MYLLREYTRKKIVLQERGDSVIANKNVTLF